MRSLSSVLLLAAAVACGRAQPAALPAVPPGVKLPAQPTPRLPDEITPEAVLPAQPHEVQLVPSLRGIVFIAQPAAAGAPPPAGFTGVDFSGAPLLQGSPIAANVAVFLNRPASLPSLERLALVARFTAREKGEAFVASYVPPQDLTAGVVRIVVCRARLDGDLAILGAEHFGAEQYRQALGARAGQEIDATALAAGVEDLNQNPFRRAVLDASAGHSAGTTRLTLRVEELRPWRFTAGYSNTGTPVTGDDRVSAGATWGDAFGRGDLLGYTFGADPELRHSLSHAMNYTTLLPRRLALTAFGAWSRIESEMPVPLTQVGHSWQAGLRLGVPLRAWRGGWKPGLAFNADLKASDNNLEFAALPITHNLTHVAQFGATGSLRGQLAGTVVNAGVALYGSPGGLTGHNRDAYFAAARYGARARYAYARVDLQLERGLPYGFSWSGSFSFQQASGALLGSEQLSGGGLAAVRGYRENSAFGDGGGVTNQELHAPVLTLFKRRGRLDAFAFFDAAALQLRVARESTDLRSAGLGANLQFGPFSARFAYGWQMKRLDRSPDRGRGHVSASVAW